MRRSLSGNLLVEGESAGGYYLIWARLFIGENQRINQVLEEESSFDGWWWFHSNFCYFAWKMMSIFSTDCFPSSPVSAEIKLIVQHHYQKSTQELTSLKHFFGLQSVQFCYWKQTRSAFCLSCHWKRRFLNLFWFTWGEEDFLGIEEEGCLMRILRRKYCQSWSTKVKLLLRD